MNKDNNVENPAITAGTHNTVWLDNQEKIETSGTLRENLETDVVIIGGGLGGVSVAYCLTKAGKRVVLVEDGEIGSGETGRTTAHLVTALDDRYYDLIKYFGEDGAKLMAQSHAEAIDFVERTAQQEGIDCNFERVKGYLFLHPSDEKDALVKEFEALQKVGVSASMLDSIPDIKGVEGKAIQFDNQAQFHPIKYLAGLTRAIQDAGNGIYTNTRATEITASGIMTGDGFAVKANHVVVATNSPVNNKYAMHLVQYAYRTYVIGALVPKGTLSKALWWDTGNMEVSDTVPPYHYVRVHPYNEQYDLLISGGEDHATGMPETDGIPEEDRYGLLEGWTKEHFPSIGEIVYRWSGQVMEPMDGAAYIGRNPWDADNVYIVTGDSGNGMTHCTIAGTLITDLILGNKNKYEDIYKPSRLNLKATGIFFKEFVGGFVTYLKKSPKKEGVESLADLEKGDGKIINIQDKKCGAYRDENGSLHIVDAACTHLQCTVHFNNDEKSWDCPCHGSRFTVDGKVINGPANVDLLSYSEDPTSDTIRD